MTTPATGTGAREADSVTTPAAGTGTREADIAAHSRLVRRAVEILCAEEGAEPPAGLDPGAQRALLRALMNTREPGPLDPEYLEVEGAILDAEAQERGTASWEDAEASPVHPRLALWHGDITRLAVDAIVNAANSALLGCRVPGHACIDNAIHSAAGLQLREACAGIVAQRRAAGLGPEPTGGAEITPGFHLPARHVLHTVGPVVSGRLTDAHRAALASSYRSCLSLAASRSLRTVALCCVSTGVFGFPQDEAARIAVSTTAAFLDSAAPGASRMRVVFDVFGARDEELYRRELGL